MSDTSTSGNLKAIAAAVAILVLLVVGYLLDAPTYLQQALTWVDGLGIWAPVVFVGMYIAVCVLVIPGSILTLGAGAVFGVIRGAIYTSVGATLGATVAFILGRTLMRDWIAAKVAGSPKLAAVDKAVEREGGKLVFLLRLSPLVPFSISNYVYGLTKIKLRHYMLASFVGMMPGILLYAYIGSLIRRVTELGAGAGGGTTPAEWTLYVVGLIATVVATLRVTAVARRALREHNVDAEIQAQAEELDGKAAGGEARPGSGAAPGSGKAADGGTGDSVARPVSGAGPESGKAADGGTGDSVARPVSGAGPESGKAADSTGTGAGTAADPTGRGSGTAADARG